MGKIRDAITQATDKVELMTALETLKNKLQKLGSVPQGPDVYDYAIKYFNIIVDFQDKYAFKIDLFKDSVEAATSFADHLRNTGRCQYGWVRAPRGESVTLHNLYLGDIYGIWTNTAAFFKEFKSPIKDQEQFIHQAIQHQLSSFITSHREPMINYITSILQNNKKPDNFIIKKALERRKNFSK